MGEEEGAAAVVAAAAAAAANDDDDRSSAKYHDRWAKYHDRWDAFSKEEVRKIEREEEALKKHMERATISNEMDEKARNAQNEKKRMLKEAKERWKQSEDKEMSRRFVIEKETEVTKAIRAEELEHNSKSLHFREVAKCRYEIKKCAKPIKLFIESAKDTTISCAGSVKTSTMEIWNCSNCEITLKAARRRRRRRK